ncbi:MAG: hypothetical protein QG594_2462, partial [Bacteroidota bacterium]|nr:hypothetical protein [Bacteroidota bacterium]
IYFYSDSTNESSKHRLRLSYNVSVDTKETYKEEMESLAEMKKAYTKIINTEAKNLIVTYNPKTNRMVIRENLPLQQRKNIGKALLMEEVNDLIWQDSY